jgi:predicted ArsR family transcriptional regulator
VSEMRERLARAQALNESRPPARTGALPAIPGVPPQVTTVLMRLLAGGPLSASEAGLAIGVSKPTAKRYMSAMRDAGAVTMTGGGRGSRWRLTGPAQSAAPELEKYTTIAELAEAAHDGLVPGMTEEQREVLEQVWQIAHRPRLTVIEGGGGDSQ